MRFTRTLGRPTNFFKCVRLLALAVRFLICDDIDRRPFIA